MDGHDVHDYLSAGEYLGYRLLELGVTHVFNVPGDFNLPVLDAMARVPGLTLVNSASELNCAYAADGFARATGGLGCCVTTFLVGALSAINGIAASFAEEIPVLSVVGVPSTRQYQGMCTLHHTVGNAEDMTQEVACYKPVTCYQTILRNFTDARYLIDKALTQAIKHRKPVLLEMCRDIPMEPHSSFGRRPPLMTRFAVPRTGSDPMALEAAAAAVEKFFEGKHMPLIVAGRRVRTCQEALLKFASAAGWGVMVQHDAKGMFPEEHPCFIGTFFPGFSSPYSIQQCYDAADSIFFIGTHFNELNFGAPPDEVLEMRSVVAYKRRVMVAHTDAYNGVTTEDLLLCLAGRLKTTSSSSSGDTGIVKLFKALPASPPAFPLDPKFAAPPGVPLTLAYVYDQVQQQLFNGDGKAALIVDTGDSMLRTHTMKLPAGARYELQLFAGNIGWAAPAGLGMSLALQSQGRRLVVCQGDGGLQMTAGEIGNYAKCGSNAIFICVNNNGYLIERYISPVPDSGYNYVQHWDYSLVAEAMINKTGKAKVLKVTTEAEAFAALETAKQLHDHFIFIEVIVDKRDAAPGAAALRQGFLKTHFSNIEGYRHLNLPGSTNGQSVLTAAAGQTPTQTHEEVRSMSHHATGSSTCLMAIATAADHEAAAAPAAGSRQARVSSNGAKLIGKSRLDLLPAKRLAGGEPGDSD